jgi:hypothetical protein
MVRKARRAKTSAVSRYRVVGEGASVMLSSALSGIFGQVRDETDLLMTKVEDRVMVMRSDLMRLTFASILIGIGALVIISALLLYLVDYFQMRWATALLITGVIMLAIAYIIRMGRK